MENFHQFCIECGRFLQKESIVFRFCLLFKQNNCICMCITTDRIQQHLFGYFINGRRSKGEKQNYVRALDQRQLVAFN